MNMTDDVETCIRSRRYVMHWSIPSSTCKSIYCAELIAHDQAAKALPYYSIDRWVLHLHTSLISAHRVMESSDHSAARYVECRVLFLAKLTIRAILHMDSYGRL